MSELNCYLSKVALLPEWAKQISLNLIGAYVVLGLFQIIIKRLREPDFKLTVVFLKGVLGDLEQRIETTLKLPGAYPRIALASSVLSTAFFYILSGVFVLWFAIFIMLTVTSHKFSVVRTFGGFGLGFVFLLAGRWYFVVAERERISLVASWKSRAESQMEKPDVPNNGV